MTTLAKVRQWLSLAKNGTRAYRFEGEQANHARQLAETQASIAGFEKVEQDPEATPEQRYWLNQHRAGMEDRLAVFETKPRLTVEEMNERDAIETHLYGAPLPRQGRNVLVARTDAPTGPKRFLSALGGVQLWQALAVGWAVTFGLLGVQTARVASLKGHEREMNQRLHEASNTIDLYQHREEQYSSALASARQEATRSADDLDRERARVRRERIAEQRRQREIQDVLTHSPEPPAWSLRNDEPPTPPAGAN